MAKRREVIVVYFSKYSVILQYKRTAAEQLLNNSRKKKKGEIEMKTITPLKNAQIIVNGETVETVELKNPCQMWKSIHGWAEKHGHGVRILVTDAQDKPYKDFTVKELKNGKYYLVNAVKETNRVQAAKARKAQAEKIAKDEARKAKKRAYDKARRERLKAAKAQAAQTVEA